MWLGIPIMSYNPEIHHRRSIRLKGYDYTQPGAYFVTICTHQQACLFGEVSGESIALNPLGQVVEDEWLRTTTVRPNVVLDKFVIMPNHVHGIIMIAKHGRGTMHRAPTTERFGKPVSGSLPTIVRAFKRAATKRINHLRGTPGLPVWQRNYYEHIIRDDAGLNRIREYIVYNPQRWHLDRYNPDAIDYDEFDRQYMRSKD